MSDILSFNGLVKILQDLTTRHKQLKTFAVGPVSEMGESESITYPLFQIQPTLARMPINEFGEYKTIEIDLSFIVVDQMLQDRSNKDDVISDSLRYLQDIINELNQHPFYRNSRVRILFDILFEELEEFEDDFTAGWQADITFQFINHNTYCGLPISEIEGFSAIGPGCPTVLVQNSNESFSQNVNAGSTLILPDTDITINGTAFSGYPSSVSSNLIVQNDLGVETGSKVGNVWQVEAPSTAVTLNTSNIYKTGADTKLYDNDDGDTQLGRGASWSALSINNGFGNTNRFTDTGGTQSYGGDLVIDWAYWNQIDNTVPMWYRIPSSATSINAGLIQISASTQGGYTDWKMSNFMEALSIFNFHKPTNGTVAGVNWPPFNINFSTIPVNELWTSTEGDTNDRFQSVSDTTLFNDRPSGQINVGWLLLRTASLSELGL